MGSCRPDYLRRGRDGAIYSIHAPGVSALVLPAFLLGGLSRRSPDAGRAQRARPGDRLARGTRGERQCCWRFGRHRWRRAVGSVLLPDVHDLSRRAGGRRGCRSDLARVDATRAADLAAGVGVRSASGCAALAAHALWGHCRPAGAGRCRASAVAAPVGALVRPPARVDGARCSGAGQRYRVALDVPGHLRRRGIRARPTGTRPTCAGRASRTG